MVRAYVLISATPGKAIDVAGRLKGQDGIVQVDAMATGTPSVCTGALIVEKIQRQEGVFKTITCLAVE